MSKDMREFLKEYESITGTPLVRASLDKLIKAVEKDGTSPDFILDSARFCVEKGKADTTYIVKVAQNWQKYGRTEEKIQNESDCPSQEENPLHRQIFEVIGFKRSTTPGDTEIMDRWSKEWGFSDEEIIDAAKLTAGIREPSLRYINKVLENKLSENIAEQKKKEDAENKQVLSRYLSHVQEKAVKTQQEHIDEISQISPQVKELLKQQKSLLDELLSFDKDTRQKARKKRDNINEELSKNLNNLGYPSDFLDLKYMCPICNDTGMTKEGNRCSCLPERIKEAKKWAKSLD